MRRMLPIVGVSPMTDYVKVCLHVLVMPQGNRRNGQQLVWGVTCRKIASSDTITTTSCGFCILSFCAAKISSQSAESLLVNVWILNTIQEYFEDNVMKRFPGIGVRTARGTSDRSKRFPIAWTLGSSLRAAEPLMAELSARKNAAACKGAGMSVGRLWKKVGQLSKSTSTWQNSSLVHRFGQRFYSPRGVNQERCCAIRLQSRVPHPKSVQQGFGRVSSSH